MPRLFTGIRIPSHIATQLTLLQAGLASARWIDPSDFHITLRFFGDMDNTQANDLTQSLNSIASKPFTIKLNTLGTFGGNKPRMLWAAIAPSDPLSNLYQAHETLAQRLGFKAEGRKFTPHITLARFKAGRAPQLGQYLAEYNDYHPLTMEVTDFCLYSAKESTGGGPYLIEAQYPFQNPS